MTDSIRKRFELTGKVAVVTGASKGIGASIAAGFAEFGARVVVSSRKLEAVDAVAEKLRSSGCDAIAIAANTGNKDDIGALVSGAVEHFGGIDILVNNAATNPVYGSIESSDDRAFDKIVDVNLKGPFELCKRVHPIMRERVADRSSI